jgi:hypothetical protein
MVGWRGGKTLTKRGGRVAAVVVAAGLMVPGAFVALGSSTAAAQTSDPLGPTVAQLEAEVSQLQAEVGQLTNPAALNCLIGAVLDLADGLSLAPDPACSGFGV